MNERWRLPQRILISRMELNQLLYEQYRLLDFLEDQPTAVINGAAGTGKTMIAVEKARRNSIDGEAIMTNGMKVSYITPVWGKLEIRP